MTQMTVNVMTMMADKLDTVIIIKTALSLSSPWLLLMVGVMAMVAVSVVAVLVVAVSIVLIVSDCDFVQLNSFADGIDNGHEGENILEKV